jgi:hypothetical protein
LKITKSDFAHAIWEHFWPGKHGWKCTSGRLKLKAFIVDSVSKPGEGVGKSEFSLSKTAPPRPERHLQWSWNAEILTAYKLQVD